MNNSNRNGKRNRASFPRRAICVATMLALPSMAQAARLNYELGAGLMHSDNIALRETGEISETVFSPRLRFDFEHASSTLRTHFRGDVQYLDYRHDTYPDDTRGEFAGELDWTISPERANFIVRDSLSRQSIDSLTAFTPGNQQQINVFEAGPSFHVRVGEAMRGQLDLRYTDSYAEETRTFNSNRYNAAARLRRDLGDTDRISFNIEATRTEYDQFSSLYDYERYDAYVNYGSRLAATEINLDAGYSRLEPQGGDRSSSALFRGQAAWQASPRSKLSADAAYQFADAAQDLILRVGDPSSPIDPGIGNPDNPNLQIVPDTFKQKRAGLGYEFTGTRLHVLAQAYRERLRYLRDAAFDQDNHGGALYARYELRPQLHLTLHALRENREFLSFDRDDRDATLGIGLASRMSRHWGARLDYQRRKRDSSVGGQDYVENVVALSFTYYR